MPANNPWSIRPAAVADLDAIDLLERRCFDRDRQSRRSLRYLLTRAHAFNLVALASGNRAVSGYVTVLLRTGTTVARLYSIAVAPATRRGGVAWALVAAAERRAAAEGMTRMRLELRASNAASRGLFGALGYAVVAELPGYYPDGEAGLRLQKGLGGVADG